MVSVSELLWPARRPKLEGIEDIAARIAAGDPPAASEIVAVLDAARCSDEHLAKAVERHRRVAELRRRLTEAAAARKRFAVLDTEVKAAEAAVEAAVKARQAVIERVGREHLSLKIRVDDARHAEEALLDVENLPPADAERLTAAQGAADAAAEHVTESRDTLAGLRRMLASAEAALPDAEHEAASSPGNADAAAAAERLRNSMAARRERVAAAERVLAEAEAVAAKAERQARTVRAAIEKAVSA